MKRTAIIIILLLTVQAANAQLGIRTGVKAGYGWATLAGDELQDATARKALTGGVAIEFNLLILSFQIEALYSPRGAVLPNDMETRLAYLSVPILLKMKFLPLLIHPYVCAGPEFNYLLSAKSGDENVKDQLNAQDLAVAAGAGVEFSLLGKSAYVEARYSYGLNRINKENGFGEAKNRVAQIFVGVLF